MSSVFNWSLVTGAGPGVDMISRTGVGDGETPRYQGPGRTVTC